MLCAALGGVGKHGDDRLLLYESTEALCAAVCDGSKLGCVGILVQAAVCEQESTVCAVLAIRYIDDEETGY